jgi:hypothetical protein
MLDQRARCHRAGLEGASKNALSLIAQTPYADSLPVPLKKTILVLEQKIHCVTASGRQKSEFAIELES